MNQKYPAGSQSFRRSSDVEEKLAFTSSAVSWSSVLFGKALSDFYGKFVPKFSLVKGRWK